MTSMGSSGLGLATAKDANVNSMADLKGKRVAWVRGGDEAAWARFLEAAPYFVKHTATVGAGVSKDEPWEGAGYSYPILVANASYDQDVAYSLVKAMTEGYDDYKDGAPGANGWATSSQNFRWVIPFHDGAVKYYRGIGVWDGDMQAHNDGLVKRQDILAKAWKNFLATQSGGDQASFRSAWMKARASALSEARLDPLFN